MMSHTHLAPVLITMLLPCALVLAGCPEPECEGAACGGPQPIAAKDLGPTLDKDADHTVVGKDMAPDMPIISVPDMRRIPDVGGFDGDMDPDMEEPTGIILSQSIISQEFGSPNTNPELIILGQDSIFTMVEREPELPAQFIESFQFANGMWEAGLPFADAMARNASGLRSSSRYGSGAGSIIYKSTGDQNYYYGTFNGNQWEGSELPGIFSGSTDITVEAITQGPLPEADPAIIVARRAASQPDNLVVFKRSGPSNWEEAYTLPTRNDEWKIDDADVTFDVDSKLQSVFLEYKLDGTFTGGRDTQITYVDPDDLSTLDIVKGGAYERRPSIRSSVNGRLHIFYRQSDNLASVPLNADPYDLYTRVREPRSKTWSAPMELRRKMLYYEVLNGPEDSLILIGIDTAGDFFLRRYRNRIWSNLQTIKTDFPAIMRTDTSDHMDAAIDDNDVLHVIYRTENTAELAYFSYRL